MIPNGIEALLALLVKLVLGSYAYTTLMGGFLWRHARNTRSNHIKHLEDRVSKLERKEM